MHYSVLVILEEQPEELRAAVEEVVLGRPQVIEDRVTALLKPYKDQYWDWWRIGGRWTGHLDGYDPEKDPANLEPCLNCRGVDCATCKGTGTVPKWPTKWRNHPGDILPVVELTQDHLKVAHIVVEGWGWYAGERYVPWALALSARFVEQELPPLEWIQQTFPHGVAVIVDCHN